MEIKNIEKPTQINIAVKLLWTIFVIGFIKVIIEIEHLTFQASLWFITTICIFVITISALCIIFISKGKNWARIIYFILFFPGLIYTIPLLLDEFIYSPLLSLLSVIQIVMEVVVLYLIFTKPGRKWFKKEKK